jgi:hypothetical protein
VTILSAKLVDRYSRCDCHSERLGTEAGRRPEHEVRELAHLSWGVGTRHY